MHKGCQCLHLGLQLRKCVLRADISVAPNISCRSCRQALHKRKVRPIIAVKSMMAAAAATAGVHDEALVAGSLYHQSIHHQQQQQQVVMPMGYGGALLPQLTATADTLSALSDVMSQTQHVANMLAATRAQLHSGAAAAAAAAAPGTHETAAVLHPPVAPLMPMPCGNGPVAQAAERQDSSSYSNTSSPVASNSTAEPGLQAAVGSGTQPAAAPTATEAEFESLLQSLLFEELGSSGGMLQDSLAGNPPCSSGSASLAGSRSVFPPNSAPTASAGASSGSYASWQTNALGALLPQQPCAATPAACAPRSSCYPELQPRQLLPAGPAAAGLLPAAAAAGAVPVGLEAASTAARLHALNAELFQVQSRLLALVQATQNPAVAGCNMGY